MAKCKRPGWGDKRCVQRHRRQCSASADSIDKAIETKERQAARRDLAERMAEVGCDDCGASSDCDCICGDFEEFILDKG